MGVYFCVRDCNKNDIRMILVFRRGTPHPPIQKSGKIRN
eukprot:UN09258